MIKIGHFGNFCPHQAGIHSAARDLVLAERTAGLDSNYIDYGSGVGCTHSRVWMKDGEVETVSPEWAVNEADIIVHHSAIPPKVAATGKPIVFYLHGRPEYSFILDWRFKKGCMRAEMAYAKNKQYKKFLTFWPEHKDTWSHILNVDVDYVSPPVDLKNYSLEGKKYELKPTEKGRPNILICDMWREDISPFNSVLAAIKFAEEHCPEARIHIVALPLPKANPVIDPLFANLRKSGKIGKLTTIIPNLDEMMRACDILVSPVGIETRTSLEAAACGLSIVGGNGNSLASFVADPRDIGATSKAIAACWEKTKNKGLQNTREENRKSLESKFNLEKTGKQVKGIYEGILERNKQ